MNQVKRREGYSQLSPVIRRFFTGGIQTQKPQGHIIVPGCSATSHGRAEPTTMPHGLMGVPDELMKQVLSLHFAVQNVSSGEEPWELVHQRLLVNSLSLVES